MIVGCTSPAPGGTTQTVGRDGGTIALGTEATLTIPPGALGQPVEIAVRKLDPAEATTQLAGLTARSAVYALTPHGQTFASPVQVELAYTGAGAVEVVRKATPEASEWTGVVADLGNGKARFSVTSFSLYAVVERRSDGCGLDVGFDFDTDAGRAGWEVSANIGSDLAGSWNAGNDGSRFTTGHFRLATSGASPLDSVAHVVSPLLRRGSCSTVRASFNHEIVTNAQALGNAVMSAEWVVVRDGDFWWSKDGGTVIKNHAPATNLGQVPTLSYDITQAIPPDGAFRLVWRSVVKAPGESARWVFDDLRVTGDGHVPSHDAGVADAGAVDAGTPAVCAAPVSAGVGSAS